MVEKINSVHKQTALEYYKIYSKTVLILFSGVIAKNYFLIPGMTLFDLRYLFLVLATIKGLLFLYTINDTLARATPVCLALFSYFSHVTFIFRGSFEVDSLSPE